MEVAEDDILSEDAVVAEILGLAVRGSTAVSGAGDDVPLDQHPPAVPERVVAPPLTTEDVCAHRDVEAVVDDQRAVADARGRVALEEQLIGVEQV